MKHIITGSKELCSGCGVCKSVCPTNAIIFTEDREGFLIPAVDEDKCINCGLCTRHCHLQCTGISGKLLNVSRQYAVKAKDDETRKKSRSGGMFTVISNEILRRGGIVYGAVMQDASIVVHTRAEDIDTRDAMRGSKYVQSETKNIWKSFKEDVFSGRPVLFSGTPCQVAAASRLIEGEHENLFLCDFLCHGVPSQKIWRDYLSYMERKYRKKITAFEFRDKQDHTWESHVEKISFGSKTIWSRRYANIFSSNNCLRRCCYQCPYTKMDRVSDFTLGDYWGIDEVVPDFNDGKGISLLLVRGEKGEKLFDCVKAELNVSDTSAMPPIHYNLKRPTAMPDSYSAFWEDYHSYGFGYVSSKYGRYDLLRRIKYKIIDRMD